MTRSQSLQDFTEMLRKQFDIGDDFVAASEHPASCKCSICLNWWAKMGPEDPEMDTGRMYPSAPFTDEEIEARRKELESESG